MALRQAIPRCFAYVGYGSATQYHGLADGKGFLTTGTGGVDHPTPVAGTIRKLEVFCKDNGTVAEPWLRQTAVTVTVAVNRVATALHVTLLPGETHGFMNTLDIDVDALDDVGYIISGGQVNYPGYTLGVCVEWESPTNVQIFGLAGLFSTTVDVFGGALGNGFFTEFLELSPTSSSYSICPIDGAVTHLCLKKHNGVVGSAGSWTVTLRKNGVLQDGSGGTIDTRTVLTGENTGVVGTFSVPATLADHFDVVRTRQGTPVADSFDLAVGVGFTATNPRAFMFCGGSNDAIAYPGPTWKWNHSVQDGTYAATEEEWKHSAPVGRTGFTAFAYRVERTISGPGAGETFTHTVTKNTALLSSPSQDTDLEVVLADAVAAGNDVGGTTVFAPGDLITQRIEASIGAASSPKLYWGIGLLAPELPARLTVRKVNPDDTSKQFTIDVGGGLDPAQLTLRHGHSYTYDPVTPGTYSVSETAPEGYDEPDIVVSNSDPAGAISIGEDETIIATVFNNETPSDECECCVATKLSIIQGACYRLGISRVPQDIDEDSREAATARDLYDKARKEVLRAHPWAFATKYADSADDVSGYMNLVDGSLSDPAVSRDDGAVEWLFAYRYPVDCVFARRFVEDNGRKFDPNQKPFRVGRTWNDDPNDDVPVLFSNEENPVLEYTADVECSEDFHDQLFEDALTALLAWKMAPSLGRDAKLQKELRDDYTNALTLATSRQEQEQQQEKPGDASWTEARG